MISVLRVPFTERWPRLSRALGMSRFDNLEHMPLIDTDDGVHYVLCIKRRPRHLDDLQWRARLHAIVYEGGDRSELLEAVDPAVISRLCGAYRDALIVTALESRLSLRSPPIEPI